MIRERTRMMASSSSSNPKADEKSECSSSSSLESHFHLSKSRVNDAVSTLEKTILETAKKRERELSEKKTLIDRLYERLELTREMVAEGEKALTESEKKLQRAREENEMLRKVVEECTRKESTWKRKGEWQERKAREARERVRECWVSMDKVAVTCDAIVNGVDDDEVETVDFGEDIEEDCGEREKLSRELGEEEAREEKENEYAKKKSSSSSSSSSSSRIQSLVKTLSKSVRNLESAVQKERTYRKMADAEVEKARKCIMDEVDGEKADLKIAAARLTKALSLLKHTGDSCSSLSV